MARFLVIVLATSLTGCVIPHYVQHRAALVPHAEPVQTTGQPMEQQVGLELGATNLADLSDPRAGGPDAPAGIAVAEHQVRAAFALAPTPNFHMTFLHERAFEDGSHAISPSIPPLEDESATGYGMGFDYSVRTGTPGWRVGVATELVMWSCPYVSYTTETYSGDMTLDEGRSVVPIGALAVTPSYRSGAWTGFANFTMRNHPTMIEKTSSDLIAPDPDVKGGPLNVVAAAGVAFRQENVELALEVHQTLTDDPVQYGPAIGLMLRIVGGKRTQPQPAPVVTTPSSPPLDAVIMRRQAAWQLTKQAAAAARVEDCTTVRELDKQVLAVDADFHDTVFMQDFAIARCIVPTK